MTGGGRVLPRIFAGGYKPPRTIGLLMPEPWIEGLERPWPWFQAETTSLGGSPETAWRVYLHCPQCGAIISLNDQDLHLRWHGIVSASVVEEIRRRQVAAVDGAPLR